METDSPARLVAAIDFGTTFSGLAFSLRHEFESNPLKVISKAWSGGALLSPKGPTCVLIKPDGETLDRFGYEAESKYADLAREGQHTDWYFFRRFKMTLFTKEGVLRTAEIEDETMKKLPALLVFSLSIRFLKDSLLQMLGKNSESGTLLEGEIKWVLTVPAIWDDSAKQFMREAAEMAGIQGSLLVIALEPEAASLYCRHQPLERSTGSLAEFSAGTKYLVLDAGGGTVDITVHEVQTNGTLKELHTASGGAWGGTRVDEAYRQFIIKLLSAPVLYAFREQHMDDYVEMFEDFEVKKRTLDPAQTDKVTVRIPVSLVQLYEDKTGESFKESIKNATFSRHLHWAGNRLRLDMELVKGFFKDAVNSILKHLRELFTHPAVGTCSAILMVGGFSESKILQYEVRRNFSNIRVIVPEEAGLAVLKGAVIFGHSPTVIASRLSKYSYGVKCQSKFEEGFHPESHKVLDKSDGSIRCRDAFSLLVKAGQEIGVDEEKSEIYTVSSPFQTRVGVHFYASMKLNPKLVDEAECRHIGEITVSVPGTGGDRDVKVLMKFGKTEIEASALVISTGDKASVKLNFLG